MRFLCTGISHKTASLAVRERLSVPREDVPGVLEQLAGAWPDAEFMILSTCNRTEIYAVRPVHGRPRIEEIGEWFGDTGGIGPGELREALYALEDDAAVSHLFRVAAGLDSLVPGEDQIVAQVKEARSAAVDAGVAGGLLCGCVDAALRAAKQVRTETGISAGKVSVASVAVDCINRVFESLRGHTILSVGGGKMNRILLNTVGDLDPARILVCNRSPVKADRLAAGCGGTSVPFERLGESLAAADVVVTSTGSRQAVITVDMIRAAQKHRRWRPMLLIDLAVPRDVESGVWDVENVFLYNVDDLDTVVRATLDERRVWIEEGERLVGRHVEAFMREMVSRDTAPTIEALYQRLDEIIEDELEDAWNKLSSHDDADEDMEILRRAIRRGLRKFCHPAVEKLRQSEDPGKASRRAEVLRRLFELDG